jgi:hypothetical protein
MSFLLDFIALESLSNIYMLSIKDCIKELKRQVNAKINYELEDKSKSFIFIQNSTEDGEFIQD